MVKLGETDKSPPRSSFPRLPVSETSEQKALLHLISSQSSGGQHCPQHGPPVTSRALAETYLSYDVSWSRNDANPIWTCTEIICLRVSQTTTTAWEPLKSCWKTAQKPVLKQFLRGSLTALNRPSSGGSCLTPSFENVGHHLAWMYFIKTLPTLTAVMEHWNMQRRCKRSWGRLEFWLE